MVVTFLPHPDFAQSVRALSNRHLGKQRVEAYQILRALQGKTKGWRHHTATAAWRGYETALAAYLRAAILEWISRGKKNNMQIPQVPPEYTLPWWLGWDRFHASHRMMLILKQPSHYGKHFAVGRDIPDEHAHRGYIWPGNLTPEDRDRPLVEISAPIPENLVDPIYCPVVSRSGHACGIIVKNKEWGVCGVHKAKRAGAPPVPAASCCPALTRAGKVCGSRVKNPALGVCGVHKAQALPLILPV